MRQTYSTCHVCGDPVVIGKNQIPNHHADHRPTRNSEGDCTACGLPTKVRTTHAIEHLSHVWNHPAQLL
jgi:hypothetical protein